MTLSARALPLVALLLSGGSLHAETLQGRGIEVIDILAERHAEVRLGVDPAVASKLLRKEITVVDGPGWKASLVSALDVLDLVVLPVRENQVILVTEATTAPLAKAIHQLDSNGLEAAQETFDRLRGQFPNSLQARIMAETLGTINDEVRATKTARTELEEAIASRNNPVASARYTAYLKASWRLHEKSYEAVRLASSTGMGVVLEPVIGPLLEALEAERAFEEGLPITRSDGGTTPDEADPRGQVRELLQEEKEALAARRNQSNVTLRKALHHFKGRKYADAYHLFLQANELSNHSIPCRAYIAMMQMRKRMVNRKRVETLVATPHTPPDAAEIATRVDGLVDRFEETRDGVRAAWLQLLMHHEPTLFSEVTQAVHDRLDRLADHAEDPREVGRMHGLATAGGEYINGSLLPVSLALDTRREFTTQYDFKANDAAQSFDVFMQVSFVQMLQWLDMRSDENLYRYHITLHFKDLFSGKGGDSLGGVMGVCGFSALYNIPVRQHVTATGSIRADGAIGAVGGIVAKMQAAIAEHKHTVVVPADNEAELYLLPASTVDDIRIIIGRNMDDYLFHGLAGAPERLYEWRRSEGRYRIADLCYSLGLYGRARACYTEVLETCPNDYSSEQQVKLLEERGIQPEPMEWMANWNGHWHGPQPAPVTLTVREGDQGEEAERLRRIADLSARFCTHLLNDNKRRFNGGYLLDFAALLDPDSTTVLALQGRQQRGLNIPADETIAADDEAALIQLIRAFADDCADEGDHPLTTRMNLLCNMLLMEVFGQEDDEVVVNVTRLQKKLGASYTFALALNELRDSLGDWYERGDGKTGLIRKPIDDVLFAERYHEFRESGLGLLRALLEAENE